MRGKHRISHNCRKEAPAKLLHKSGDVNDNNYGNNSSNNRKNKVE